MNGLIWFRQDVRLIDNEAVNHAWNNADTLHAVVVISPEQWKAHDWSPAKLVLYQSLVNDLGAQLQSKGVTLHVLRCDWWKDIPAALLELCEQLSVDKVWLNRDYPLDEVRRDRAVCGWLTKHGIEVSLHDSNLLVAPERVKTGQGEYYKKFTPFYKQWKSVLAETGVAQPAQLRTFEQNTPNKKSKFAEFSAVEFVSRDCTNAAQVDSDKTDIVWPDNRETLLGQLRQFFEQRIEGYKTQRDYPSVEGTSRLSPYFELGAISPLTVARCLQPASPEFPYGLSDSLDTWLSELAWREFYQHLMFNVPELSMGKAFVRETEHYPWRHNKADFERWCEGRTGVPIVDAGMRQLKAEKWMHNRVRMIVASYLTKDLHIDWRWGEKYFMQNLIDGSFAANNGGWQWSASTGTDAVPYFRVFNPYRQGERFDPAGEYVRRWVEELSEVPKKYIHQPQDWLRENKPDSDYPDPLVDHSKQRQLFIEQFKRIKGS